jgi:hypothetical protein
MAGELTAVVRTDRDIAGQGEAHTKIKDAGIHRHRQPAVVNSHFIRGRAGSKSRVVTNTEDRLTTPNDVYRRRLTGAGVKDHAGPISQDLADRISRLL